MKNMKIGVRLGIGFMAIVVLMIAVAFVGITRLSAINHETEVIVKDRVVKVALSSRVIDQINLIARASRNVLLMTDQGEINRDLERIAVARKTALETLSTLEKMLNTEKGKALFKTVMEARGPYAELTTRFIKSIEEGKKEDGLKLLLGEIRPKQLAYQKTLEDMNVYLIDVMNKAAADAEEQYKTARLIMLILTAFVTLVSATVRRPFPVIASTHSPARRSITRASLTIFSVALPTSCSRHTPMPATIIISANTTAKPPPSRTPILMFFMFIS